jgi:hypothetical protein
MTKWTVNSFPTEVGRQIDLPDFGELITMPMFKQIDLEIFKKRACNTQKYLLRNAPISNKYKHIFIDSYVQLLYPNTLPSGGMFGYNLDDKWYVETEYESKEIYHLYETNSTCKTIFNDNKFEIDIEDRESIVGISKSINKSKDKLTEKEAIPNRFITYSNHPHKDGVAKKFEFRFVFKVTESNIRNLNGGLRDYTEIYDMYGKPIKSVVHKIDGVELYYPHELWRRV